MLKVNSDLKNQDYIEYLRPFVLAVLNKNKPDPVSDNVVADLILNEFGLNIPNRAINLVLRRLAKQKLLKKDMGVFSIVSTLPDSGIELHRTEASRNIQVVITNLVEYSKSTPFCFTSEDSAIEALLSFLSDFSIDCLRTYVFGTAIPDIPERNNKAIVLISKFVKNISQKDLPLFDSFMVIVKGQMLSNALLCPDLDSQRQAFNKVKFYLDTPFVIRLLGLEGVEKKSAALETIELVQILGGKFAIFEHTYQEVYNVIRGAAGYIDHPDGKGGIVIESRRAGKTRSDLLLIAQKLDGELLTYSILKAKTPPYEFNLQIDEVAFEGILEDEVHYYNDKAKLFDINSVRSIYVLRHGLAPVRLEDANAAIVTPNASFAHAAYEYGKQFEETREVSSVITDFSLANIAWLKRPLKAPELPQREVIAYAYAAMNPRAELWAKYLDEIEKLAKRKDISESDHAVLRYSLRAREELMDLTLGDEEALNTKTVSAILEKASTELQGVKKAELYSEQEAHEKTKRELDVQIRRQAHLEAYIERLSHRIGVGIGIILSILLGTVVIYGVVYGVVGIRSWTGIIVVIVLTIFAILSMLNLCFGTTVKHIFTIITTKSACTINKFMLKKLSSEGKLEGQQPINGW